MDKPNWNRLEDVYALAREKQVGFSLDYVAADSSWYFRITSSAASECWIGKSRLFDHAVDDVIERLKAL